MSRWEEGFLTQMVYPTGLSSQQAPVPGTRQENETATRLDEGLEDFFSRRVMDESSRCGAQAHPPTSAGPEALEGSRVHPSPREASPMAVPQSQSLWEISPTFSFLHTEPLVAMFSESPQDSRKERGQSEPPQWDWGWGDSRPWNGVTVSGTRPGGCVLSLSCTDSPASLHKELGHLERLRGDGGRGACEGRGCWRVVTGKVRTPFPENRWKGLWNGRKD